LEVPKNFITQEYAKPQIQTVGSAPSLPVELMNRERCDE
jgi:hypothetical protein